MQNTSIIKSLFLFLFLAPLAAIANLQTSGDLITYKFTFSKHEHFIVSFADYPKGQEAFYELQYKENSLLPPHIKTNQHALKISGNNHSDDLFMYAYKQISGLKPNTSYKVHFLVELASNASAESIGVGGSPGASVYVKIGVVSDEPHRYIDEFGYYRMALDKGNQEEGGKEMLVLGNIGVDTHDNIYRLKTLTDRLDEMNNNFSVTSDNQGRAWLILGTDSGYESTSTVFYTNVIVNFSEFTKDI